MIYKTTKIHTVRFNGEVLQGAKILQSDIFPQLKNMTIRNFIDSNKLLCKY